jgi:hypothetical protein
MRRFAVCCVYVQLINIGFYLALKTKVLTRALLYKVPIVVLSSLFQKIFSFTATLRNNPGGDVSRVFACATVGL